MLRIAPHLSLEELRRRERAAPTADRPRWRAVRLMAEGRSATEVGLLVGWTAPWVRAVVHRYNAAGPDALSDGRRQNPGAPPLLDATQQVALRAAMEGPAPDGGVWTSGWVAEWMSQALGRPVSSKRAWDWMVRLGCSHQSPRSCNDGAASPLLEPWHEVKPGR